MRYKRHQHSYDDNDLITATEFSAIIGISGAAISKKKSKGQLDTFDNSKGQECFHRVASMQQYMLTKDRRKVTTTTRAQRWAGLDNTDAQANAHVIGSELPQNLFNKSPNRAPLETIDLGSELENRQSLEISRAEKEFHMARLSKLKADEKEGSLVDKQLVLTKTAQYGAQIQEKVMNLYVQLAPKIVGVIQEDLCGSCKTVVEHGEEKNVPLLDAGNVRIAMKDSSHKIGEMIRKECADALAFMSEKLLEDFFA